MSTFVKIQSMRKTLSKTLSDTKIGVIEKVGNSKLTTKIGSLSDIESRSTY